MQLKKHTFSSDSLHISYSFIYISYSFIYSLLGQFTNVMNLSMKFGSKIVYIVNNSFLTNSSMQSSSCHCVPHVCPFGCKAPSHSVEGVESQGPKSDVPGGSAALYRRVTNEGFRFCSLEVMIKSAMD